MSNVRTGGPLYPGRPGNAFMADMVVGEGVADSAYLPRVSVVAGATSTAGDQACRAETRAFQPGFGSQRVFFPSFAGASGWRADSQARGGRQGIVYHLAVSNAPSGPGNASAACPRWNLTPWPSRAWMASPQERNHGGAGVFGPT